MGLSGRVGGCGGNAATPGLKRKNKGRPMGWAVGPNPSGPSNPKGHPNHIGALDCLACSCWGFAVAVHKEPK
jgi:hypothetical protein